MGNHDFQDMICRLSRVSGLNGHEMRWEGRNFEGISTDLVWTAHEAGKIWAILSESHDAACHQHAGSTCGHYYPPYGLITYLCICHTFFIILCRVGHFKAATIKCFAYIWKSTSILEALAPDQAGKNTLGHRTKRFLSGSPCLKSVGHKSSTVFGAILTGTEWEILARLPSFTQIFFDFILDIVASKQMFLLCSKTYPKPCSNRSVLVQIAQKPDSKGPVIIYRLGGRSEDFGLNTMKFSRSPL